MLSRKVSFIDFFYSMCMLFLRYVVSPNKPGEGLYFMRTFLSVLAFTGTFCGSLGRRGHDLQQEFVQLF